MDDFVKPMLAIGTAIIGVAIISVIVSKQSNTTGVIDSLANGFSKILGVAVSPVTGSGTNNGSGGSNYGAFSPVVVGA